MAEVKATGDDMTEQEVYRKIRPMLEGYEEGLYWDFKKSLNENQLPDIIKDILAFSNSTYQGDSYIIIGVKEPSKGSDINKIQLTSEDRQRLNTDANYIIHRENGTFVGLVLRI